MSIVNPMNYNLSYPNLSHFPLTSNNLALDRVKKQSKVHLDAVHLHVKYKILTVPKIIVRLRAVLGFEEGVDDGLTVPVVLELLPLTVELTDVGRPSVADGGDSRVS